MKKVLVGLFALTTFAAGIAGAHEPDGIHLPPGAVLAYIGSTQDLPDGWVVCGEEGTPNLEGRFLVGTNDLDQVGDFIGSSEHAHSVDLQSTEGPKGRPAETLDSSDNYSGQNWQHTHYVRGETKTVAHLPPSIQVLLLCNPRR